MKTLTVTLTALAFILITSCNDTKKNTENQNTANTEEIKDIVDKTSNSLEFTDVKWKLVNIMGKDVANSEAFISFATEDNRVFGNAGCNNFTGTYKLKEGMYFELSPIAATKKMCADMSVETPFLKILEKADNYSINQNKLTLQKGKTAPLAVFEAVE